MGLLLHSIKENKNLKICIGQHIADNQDNLSLYENAKYNIENSQINKFYVSPRLNWVSGDVYQKYPSNNSYVVVDGVRVYVCVSNNSGSNSIQKPTHKSLFNVKESDGYVWRFLFDIESNDIFNYFRHPRTTRKTPIQNPIASLYSPNTDVIYNEDVVHYVDSMRGTNAIFEYDVEPLDDTITNITLVSGGSRYSSQDVFIMTDNTDGQGATVDFHIDNGSIVIDGFSSGTGYQQAKVFIVGDGQGASANVTVSGGAVSDVVLLSGGSNYTWAKIYILSSENSHCSRIQLESPNGFGYNFSDDIKPSKLAISATVDVNTTDVVDYLLITSKPNHPIELPTIYVINKFNELTLSPESDNILYVFLSG